MEREGEGGVAGGRSAVKDSMWDADLLLQTVRTPCSFLSQEGKSSLEAFMRQVRGARQVKARDRKTTRKVCGLKLGLSRESGREPRTKGADVCRGTYADFGLG